MWRLAPTTSPSGYKGERIGGKGLVHGTDLGKFLPLRKWLRVSCEVAIRMSARAVSSSECSWKQFTSKFTDTAGGRPQVPASCLHRRATPTTAAGSQQASQGEREYPRRKPPSFCHHISEVMPHRLCHHLAIGLRSVHQPTLGGRR